MVTFVLDASAVLRFLDQEAGEDSIAEILKRVDLGTAEAVISAMHWGEIVGVFYKRHDSGEARRNVERLRTLQLTVIPVTGERAERCAVVKFQYKIPYVDALAVELAMTIPDSNLITADFDFKTVERLVSIEFLPLKKKSAYIHHQNTTNAPQITMILASFFVVCWALDAKESPIKPGEAWSKP